MTFLGKFRAFLELPFGVMCFLGELRVGLMLALGGLRAGFMWLYSAWFRLQQRCTCHDIAIGSVVWRCLLHAIHPREFH